MAINRGKQFEGVVKECFERVPGVSIDRLHDQTNGFLGSANICDYIVYKEPYEYYVECKSVHGNTLSIHGTTPKNKYGNISNTQWEGLLEKSKIKGVIAGVIVWWIDKDVTRFIPIQVLAAVKDCFPDKKSIRFDDELKYYYLGGKYMATTLSGKKKRVFFDYDMEKFLKEASKWVK